ncbi:hypothetical protein WH47_08425 [Habropoda laboriosa]|uniref:Histone-lysine N-methyltransferase SETMAR n=1 Tax=Habropoda laboriosa TaxID=597456 RepID=A0A0L7RFM5_9HYME|nr:hypothetical protein WH47_08425 [Habropoda laboriosa]
MSLGWEILPRAAYSLDYYLFRSLQHHLIDSKFKTYEDVNNSVRNRHHFFEREFANCLRNEMNV